MPSTRELAVALLDSAGRAEAARALAVACGAEDLIVFVTDPELDFLLPGPGFPRTLPQGRRWRKFVSECRKTGTLSGQLPHYEDEREVPAAGLSADGGSVFVFLGGSGAPTRQDELREYLPFLSAVFRSEQCVQVSEGHAQAARQAAAKADALTQRLDTTRAELQAALRAVETANRSKDEFLAMVSHELRTPLNAILGWASLLRLGRIGNFTSQQALETIELNAQSQARLIEDLLDFSRIAAGKLTLDSREVSMTSVIDAAVDTVQLSANAKNIRLYVALVRRGMIVTGDPDRLQQVVWNLLSNAIKFTPEGGRVEITLENDGKHLELAVRDTGPGIEPDFLPYVFDRFRQADSSSTRRFSGLGLGLAITRHLVELHGGTIAVVNGTEDGGAIFTVRLPLAATPAPAPMAAPRLHASTDGLPAPEMPEFADLSGITVLIVDDEPDTLSMQELFLAQSGARVRACASVREALHSLLEGKPDVLISDIAMPGEDGYSLMRKFRALEENSGTFTPAIALTSHASKIDRDNALAMGFQLHIAKPVAPVALVQAVFDLVHRTRPTGAG